jgi:hypothetical protein
MCATGDDHAVKRCRMVPVATAATHQGARDHRRRRRPILVIPHDVPRRRAAIHLRLRAVPSPALVTISGGLNERS